MPEHGPDQTQQIQLLYELALAVGRTLDPVTTCEEFLSALLSRRALSFGAVWIRGDSLPHGSPCNAHLLYALPRTRARDEFRPVTDQMFTHTAPTSWTIDTGETVAVLPLGNLGWLELLSDCAPALTGLPLSMLRSVVGKLAVSLEGALSHQRLQIEVADRRRAELRLKEALAEREAIVAAVPDLLFTADAHGRLLWRNARLPEVMGSVDDDATGRPIHHLVTRQDHPALDAWLSKTITDGHAEVDVHISDGTELRRFHLTGVRLMHGDPGSPMATIVGAARDVTDRERAADERREMERRMLHAQKLESLGVLAGGIAHDFNNLLVPILAHAELVRRATVAPSPEANSLEAIVRASTRAADLARQMLAYSGRARPTVGRVDLGRLVAEIALLLEVAISKKVTLDRELGSDTPVIEGDGTQLRQVVMNLVTNASEAIGDEIGRITLRSGFVAHPGGPIPGLVEGNLGPGRFAFVEVADTGAGMAPEIRSRIFDPFFSTKFTGRGLGLAAVLGIVRAHHGVIAVTTNAGQGSTFRVLLPAAAHELQDLPPQTLPGRKGPLGPGTVLVVDDEPMVRHTIRAALEGAGLTVIEAPDGRVAIDLFNSHRGPIALVLMDLTMPRLGGKEAALAIHKQRPDVPIVLMSGFDHQEIARQVAAPVAAYFLQKPFRLGELLDQCSAALARGQKARINDGRQDP